MKNEKEKRKVIDLARPSKAGLDYFELDCHMEPKVKLIQAEFGLKGFAIVVKLYQKIYGGFGYYCEWDEDSLLLFMSDNGVSSCDEKNLINEVVLACIRRNIFSEDLFKKYGVLTSAGVQKRYLNAVSRREKVELKKEYLLVSVGENEDNVIINSVNVDRNPKNVNRNTQSREKERKEDKSKGKNNIGSRVYYPHDENLNLAFIDFVDMRKAIKKPMTERAITLAMNKLKKLSAIPFSDSMDNDLAIQILEQSTMNCWQDLYPLKDNGNKRSICGGVDWDNV